jgi:hypothetical protein
VRIFLSSQQALRPHAVPAYAFWEFYFKNALAEAGHEAIETPGADWAEGLTPLSAEERAAWLDRTWTPTVDFLRREHARRRVDLFLSYLYPFQVEPAALRAVRELGIPTVNFFCDNIREFTRIPESYRDFDLHWVPEAEARALYAAAGLRFLYAPMAVWIPPAFRTPPTVETADVIFMGSHDALREDLLGAAVELGLPLRLHGAGWKPDAPATPPPARSAGRLLQNQIAFLREHGWRGVAMRATYQLRHRRPTAWIDRHWRPALRNESEYFQATRESQVVIGVNRFPSFRHSFSRPHGYSRLRDIEAPMLGACYLTESAPGLEDLYELGTEIETYSNATELAAQVERLRGDPARRSQLRLLGQRRALAHHTIARSLEEITRTLGLPA